MTESLKFPRRLRQAFLERASADADGCIDLLGFGALLVLGVVDAIRGKEGDAASHLSQINGVQEFLDDADQVQEQWFVRAILRPCASYVNAHAPAAAILEVLGRYAEWLRSEGRNDEAADITLMVSEWNAV